MARSQKKRNRTTCSSASSKSRSRSRGRQGRRAFSNSGSGSRNPASKIPRRDCASLIKFPPKENSAHMMIVLENGLKVLLISTRENKDPGWTLGYPDMSMCNGMEFADLGPSYMAPVPSDIYCGGPDPSDDRHGCMSLPGVAPKPKCVGTIMVGSGSLQDPHQFQGIAHFTEHVIHHGSENYPEEEELRDFIAAHDGYSNAYTDKTMTNYHFQVNSSPESLSKALDMYGDMMRAPTFPLESLTREVESVDNEYFLRRIFHYFQRTQLLHSVAIRGDHPMKQFMIGSKESLLANGKSGPENLKKAVHEFHKTHYYAENMRLVVRSPEPLQFMQQCVEKSFAHISQKSRCSKTPASRVPKKGSPFDKACFNRLYTVKPRHNDGHELYLTWALPAAAWQDYKCKPLEYIGSVLSNDCEGGLSYHLRSMGWSLGMVAGCSDSGTNRNEFVSLFEIIVFLTDDGRARIHEVIESIFGFIKYHQKEGAQRKVWDELRRIEQVKFESVKLCSSVRGMTNLSKWMHLFKDEEIISGGHLYFEYNGKKINEYLRQLTPGNANYILFTLDTGKTEYLTEELYQTEYLVQDLGGWLKRFEDVKPHKDCHLGNWETSCAVVPTVRIDNVCAMLEIIGMSDKILVQYAPIREMSSPQASFQVSIKSRMDVRTLMSKRCLLEVWDKMLMLMMITLPNASKHLNFVQYGIGAAQDLSFLIQLIGLNNNLANTFISMLDCFDRFEEEATIQSFQMAKELVMRNHYQRYVETKSLAMHFLGQLIYRETPTCYECHELLLKTSFSDILTFVREFKESMFFQCLVTGVVSKEDALRVAMTLQRIRTQPMGFLLSDAPLPYATRKILSSGERCLRVRSLQPKERKTTVVNFYELAPQSIENRHVFQLILTLLKPKLFHQLRTVEQLGYDVGCLPLIDAALTGMIVYVVTHADKHSPCYVDERIDNFLRSFYQNDLKPEAISAILAKRQMYRDPSYVQLFFAKYFLKGGYESGFKKISVQAIGCQGESCRCEKYEVPIECKMSEWLPPLGTIGKEKIPVRLGGRNSGSEGDANGGGPSEDYFIQNIAQFHEGE